MPEQAKRLIHFLNTHTKEQLAALEIVDRTYTILTVKKVLTMRNFIQNLERKCQEMHMEINAFTEKFTVLQQKGLPSLLTSNQKLLYNQQYAYRVNMYQIRSLHHLAPQNTQDLLSDRAYMTNWKICFYRT